MMKALVVEDDPHWQSALLRAAKAAGLEPIPVQEATSATEILKYNPDICLVLLDWNLIPLGDLPSATGEGIAAIAQERGIPIIVVSGALSDPDFIEEKKIKDPVDENYRLRIKYGVLEWVPKRRLEDELDETPPLPTLIKIIERIRQDHTKASDSKQQDHPALKDVPNSIAQIPIPPPYLISVKRGGSNLYVTITTQTESKQKSKQTSDTAGVSKTLNDNYALLMEELCLAAQGGESVVPYKCVCKLIPTLDSITNSSDQIKAVEKFLETFRQWLLRNVTGEGKKGRDLIREHLFNKTEDGIRLGQSATYDFK